MLELKNITITLNNSERTLIDNLSLTLKDNDKAVIIGEEGNGKSTLLRAIYQPDLIKSYCDFSGKIVTSQTMAYLPQNLDIASNDDISLSDFFETSEYYLYIDILEEIGLSVEFILSNQKLSTLSGGEKIKVHLAKLLMTNPDILLLDEPTNDLDVTTLKWLESFINNSKKTILYISHDEKLIENTATTIIHIEQIDRKEKCRITVSNCSYKDYILFRYNKFLHQEQVAQKQRDNYYNQMEKWQRIYNRVNYEQATISRKDPSGGRLLKKKMHSVLSMGKRFEKEKENFIDFPQQEEASLIKFNDSIQIPIGKIIIDLFISELSIDNKILSHDIKLFVCGQEHIGIIGRNGIGKSTLLSIIWEKLKNRKDIIPFYMPQNYAKILDCDKTALQYLTDCFQKDEVTKARIFMGSMRFTHEEMISKIADLSGEQKAKLIFLSMILHKANVLILDEPTRNFSPLSNPALRKALINFKGAIISVSHDRKYLEEVCDKIYELTENGLFLVK